ncbi:MAG: CinA family nicotinamide mononucleotide deamidase-related protein [Proteobacteria bacterium]|nr:CinA family nicotinamide mononucleotide deamidase-related protein [Pseudomonadota bacterium]
MKDTVSLLMVGSEILDGRTVDSNSHFLISELSAAGLTVSHVLSCGDSMEAIKQSFNFAVSRSRIVILSGGLGPTSDDITREAVAESCDLKLVLHGDILGQLEEHFRKRRRPFDPSNCKQALFPETATTINNPVGSASGFALRMMGPSAPVLIVSLPGVPSELRAMTTKTVIPMVRRELGATAPLERRVLRIFGLGESVIGSLIQQSEPHPEVEVCYRVQFPQVEVLFRATQLAALVGTVKRARLSVGPEYIFSEEFEDSMDTAIHKLLLKRRSTTVAVAESCTAGAVGELLTRNSGSSEFFLGGALTYSNELKARLLQVPKKILRDHGAVSDASAQAMAIGVRKLTGASIGISTTGIAGPTGGSDAKPVGTFFVGISNGRITNSYRFFLSSNRKNIRLYASWMALDVLRRHLLKLPIHPHRDPPDPLRRT